jgi:hypothetical protein
VARVRERDIEAYFVKRVKEAGGEQRKFVSPGHKGVADRICGFPVERFAFVELKRPGEKARPDQIREAKKWHRIGFLCVLIDSKEAVDEFIWLMTQADKRK